MTARQRATVLAKVDAQLTHQPTTATRNRKLLQPGAITLWELRVGDLHVYFLSRGSAFVLSASRIATKPGSAAGEKKHDGVEPEDGHHQA